jgi:proteic killer suppression protein
VVIQSFADSRTEAVWQRKRVRRWSPELQRTAYRKLLFLDAAESLKDVGAASGNRLEKLSGYRAGQYSIRINNQWRVCFEWRDGDAYKVEIVDYH